MTNFPCFQCFEYGEEDMKAILLRNWNSDVQFPAPNICTNCKEFKLCLKTKDRINVSLCEACRGILTFAD